MGFTFSSDKPKKKKSRFLSVPTVTFDVWQFFCSYIFPFLVCSLIDNIWWQFFCWQITLFCLTKFIFLKEIITERRFLSIRTDFLFFFFWKRKGKKYDQRLYFIRAHIISIQINMYSVQCAQCLDIHFPLIDSCSQQMAFKCRHYMCHQFSLASIIHIDSNRDTYMTRL